MNLRARFLRKVLAPFAVPVLAGLSLGLFVWEGGAPWQFGAAAGYALGIVLWYLDKKIAA